MKTIAALIAGLLLSAATFIAGVLGTSVYLTASKARNDTPALQSGVLWTDTPRRVERQDAGLQRLPARPVENSVQTAGITANKLETAVETRQATSAAMGDDATDTMTDPMTTGAITPNPTEAKNDRQFGDKAAHIAWCSHRYNSYRADDDTYQPFSGHRRPCESPYSDMAGLQTGKVEAADTSADAGNNGGTADTVAGVQQTSFDPQSADVADDDHVRSCLRRYRSYDRADNSYQPFDGGPRRQCR